MRMYDMKILKNLFDLIFNPEVDISKLEDIYGEFQVCPGCGQLVNTPYCPICGCKNEER